MAFYDTKYNMQNSDLESLHFLALSAFIHGEAPLRFPWNAVQFAADMQLVNGDVSCCGSKQRP
jgi:hypothetical protein